MSEDNHELLAGFHHTISEQLNSRLSESPKFFGLLVVVSTGYGYVLSKPQLCGLVFAATLLSLAATLWASWYLAALGYAFRFLQHSQHRIESKLQWDKCAPTPGTPPENYRNPLDWFWLLPGIYHAHAAGLSVFYAFICCVGLHGCWRYTSLAIGVVLIASANLYYLHKFKRRISTTRLQESPRGA